MEGSAETEVAASSRTDAGPADQFVATVIADETHAVPDSQARPSASLHAVNDEAVAANASATKSREGTPTREAAPAHAISPAAKPSDSSSADKDAISHNDDETDSAAAIDAATYGTRSRNRTGTARPNYAEDQDMDFEYSNALKKKSANDPTAVPTGSNGGQAEAKRASDFAHFIAVNSSNGPATGSMPKEYTPGTPVLSSSVSKKRKATAAPAAAAATGTPPPANTPQNAAMRKAAPTSVVTRETNAMTFTKHRSCLNKKGELVADDGTKLCINDHVYLVCEPPGDPYYLCRIMEFLHTRSGDPTSPIDSIRVNWYYRPRDVQRFNSDSRLLYGTMHSDLCPIASLRGKCTIKHRSEIEDLEAYRKERESFYFVQVFDRFIHRWYECIPVSQIINVPDKVKKALDERWKFVVVEIGRVKELTSDVKTCKRCAKYCATNDSVDCAICKNSYHMNCVQPPLPKKPSRGFAWACGPCSRASEKKLEVRNTPNASGDVTEVEEEEFVEEEPPDISNDTTRAPSPSASDVVMDNYPATQAEMALANMWPMRYLGIHCRVEDALQYDDRAIYPRASSRLGPRHQANVTLWPGQPVELVKPADIKKRYTKSNSHKKDGKLTKETVAALEADREERARRPKWVQDEPPGYIARGEDFPDDDPRNTAKLIFKMPAINEAQPAHGLEEKHNAAGQGAETDEYLKRAKALARSIGVPPFGANFLDKALELLIASDYEPEAALKQLQKVHRVHDLHEPVLSKQDLAKFEEGVAKYGSEHRRVRAHMKTILPISDIIRFYYLWKKTPKGQEIWGNYGGRKGSKRRNDDQGAQLQQSVANEGDDSAFDNEKAVRRNRGFQCKFCNVTHSRQWRKAPGVAPGQTVASDGKNGKEKGKPTLLALCLRCAGLWRKYAIQWEDIDEVAKKVAQGGGRAWKRRIDEELLRELVAANEASGQSGADSATAVLPSTETIGEPQKKKTKTDAAIPGAVPKSKPIPVPKEPTPPPPPIVPTQPQWKALPCAVCKAAGNTVSCAHCYLTVHRNCFGLTANEGFRADGELKWVCEQCANDRNPLVSTDYACCLCLTEETLVDLVEPPKVSHKKKTDREREKERMEKELADAMRLEYRNKQLSLNRPPLPREPLKRTTGNNWVHVYCATWMAEIRFSNAKILEVAEGFQNIPPAKVEAVCKLCKNKDHQNRFRDDKGACVACFQCHANIHASCAFEAGYTFGFDVTPVKGSRKDSTIVATLGAETGSLTAGIWCKEHIIKNVVHPINEVIDESGRTALQVFVENYKQADLTLTGTIRKANLAQLTKDKAQQAPPTLTNGSRRESTANSIAAAVRRGARTSSVADIKAESEAVTPQSSDASDGQPVRRCIKCKIDVTPKWHVVESQPVKVEPAPSTSPIQRASLSFGGPADHEGFRPAIPAPLQQPRSNVHNIRFMAPGANGRAWDGMPDRYAARATSNGEVPQDRPATSFTESSNPIASVDIQRHSQQGQQSHTLPPSQFKATTEPSLNTEEAADSSSLAFLCHKCFLKKKLGPEPSTPPDKDSVMSPARPPPNAVGWNAPKQAPSQPPFDPAQAVRMPWDEPHPTQGQGPAAPPVNGLGLSVGYGAPAQPQSYMPYGQQTNGYHAGPPPPPPQPPAQHSAPVMHERSNSFGYRQQAPPAVHQPYHAQHPPPPPSPMAIYPPPATHHLSNGTPSPHAPPYQPLQSPTRIHPPPYQGFGPSRGESPYTPAQMPLYDPRHSSGGRFPGPPALPQQSTPSMQSQPQSQPQPPPQPQPQAQMQSTQPAQQIGIQAPPTAATQARPETQAGRPMSQGSVTPGPGISGASASPSLRNLLD